MGILTNSLEVIAMAQNDSFMQKLFSPSGRSGRLDFLLTWIVSIALVLILVGIYTVIVAYIRRWHDLGKSGWFTLLILVPIVNVVMFLYLLFAPGVKQGEAGKPA